MAGMQEALGQESVWIWAASRKKKSQNWQKKFKLHVPNGPKMVG